MENLDAADINDILDDYNDGDHGIVVCGKCGKQMERWTAFLSNKYLYLCDDCTED